MIRFKASTDFDWYQATVPTLAEELIDVCRGLEGVVDVIPGGGLNRYERSARGMDLAGDQVFCVMYGGGNGWPNAVASGNGASEFAELMNRLYPGHKVTRLDIAKDYLGEGMYDQVVDVIVEIGTQARTEVSCQGKWHGNDLARTLYLGAKSSRARVRWYEKSAEVRSALRNSPDLLRSVPDHWCRLELQARPSDQVTRRLIGRFPPHELWGLGPRTRDIIERLDGERPSKVNFRAAKVSADDRTQYHLVKQYGAHMLRQLEKDGDRYFERLKADLEAMRRGV